MTEVAGEPLITGAVFGCAFTVIENAASDVVALPSLTLMTMFGYVPTCALPGVPLRSPVTVLNVAQVGLFVMLKVSVSPSGIAAVGWNEYALPAVTEVPATPLITGAVFGAAFTVIENAGNDAVALPSLTLMTMFAYEPTSAAAGVPDNRPVLALNVAQVGLFAIAEGQRIAVGVRWQRAGTRRPRRP